MATLPDHERRLLSRVILSFYLLAAAHYLIAGLVAAGLSAGRYPIRLITALIVGVLVGKSVLWLSGSKARAAALHNPQIEVAFSAASKGLSR
jgi:hypothetical protein